MIKYTAKKFVKMKSINLISFAFISFLFVTCQPTGSLLIQTNIGMSKSEIVDLLGKPTGVSLKFKTNDDKNIEVWNYRLYQYEMATSLSPYFDIYNVFFEDDKVIKIQKTDIGTILSEEGAMRLLLSLIHI